MEEQHVPEELEWDGLDEAAYHVLALSGAGQPLGCGRMLAKEGHIGRMAVLRPHRGKGIGAALLSALIDMARRQGIKHVVLDAQVSAIGFYQRHGFTAHGKTFMDAGIPHRRMRRSLTEAQTGNGAN